MALQGRVGFSTFNWYADRNFTRTKRDANASRKVSFPIAFRKYHPAAMPYGELQQSPIDNLWIRPINCP